MFFLMSSVGSLFLSTLSLRRATQQNRFGVAPHCLFLSTLSLRRATVKFVRKYPDSAVISIHALLAESDLGRQSRRQDRSPISIHALLAESD